MATSKKKPQVKSVKVDLKDVTRGVSNLTSKYYGNKKNLKDTKKELKKFGYK